MGAAEKQRMGADLKHLRFQLVFAKILESYRSTQAMDQLNNVQLQLCDWRREVDLYLPLAFVIGDVLDNMKIHCKKSSLLPSRSMMSTTLKSRSITTVKMQVNAP